MTLHNSRTATLILLSSRLSNLYLPFDSTPAPLNDIRDRDTKYGIFIEEFQAVDRKGYCPLSYGLQTLKDMTIFHLISTQRLFCSCYQFLSRTSLSHSFSLSLTPILDLPHTTPLCLNLFALP
jgi:hypothetical protein